MRVGILAVQGDFEAHAKVLAKLGVEAVLVRAPADLAGIAGLILPGGESTTQLHFLNEDGLKEALKAFAARGGAFFGTCAGAILLAREVRNPAQESLGFADLVVSRNAYGRQLSSHVTFAPCALKAEPLEMVFIRAPVIEQQGSSVQVLAAVGAHPVLVRQGRVLVATFHPELTEDSTVHEYFLKLVRNGN